MKNKKMIKWILVPALIHALIFIFLPIIGSLIISFMDYNPLRAGNNFVFLENYKDLFKDPLFFQSLKNTLIFVFVTVTLNIVFSLGIAYMISLFRSNKVKSFFRVIFFLPCVAPLVATSVVFSNAYFSKYGLFNSFLSLIGKDSILWLGDPKFVMPSMILFTLWVDIGYNIILFSAGIDGIPQYVYEAAEIDGANEWYKFSRITLPLLGRTFFFVTLNTLISHFQMFAQFSVMLLKDGPQYSGLVLSRYIYKVGFELKNLGYASAISMIFFLIILTVSVIQQRRNKIEWEY